MVKLKAFGKFENTTDALAAAASLVDSKLSKGECPLPSSPAGPTVIHGSRAPMASMVVCAAGCTSIRDVSHPVCTVPNLLALSTTSVGYGESTAEIGIMRAS